jgi:hypothetical protein
VEKAEAAKQQMHWAMYRTALGQITLDERDRILSILAPFCPDLFVAPLSLPSSFHYDQRG